MHLQQQAQILSQYVPEGWRYAESEAAAVGAGWLIVTVATVKLPKGGYVECARVQL